MAYKPPTAYTANYAVVLKGVTYAKGANIPVAVMRQQRNANMLVSSGRVSPTPDPHRRLKRVAGKWRRQPTTVHWALQQGPNIQREGAEMGITKDRDDDEPRNTLTETGMEATKEQRDKAAEKFAKGVDDLKAAGDPTDFAQERVRTTPDNKSEHAADDDLYPEDTNDDADNPGVEPGTEGQFDDDDDVPGDSTAKEHSTVASEGPHPTDAEKEAAETRHAKTATPPAKPSGTATKS